MSTIGYGEISIDGFRGCFPEFPRANLNIFRPSERPEMQKKNKLLYR